MTVTAPNRSAPPPNRMPARGLEGLEGLPTITVPPPPAPPSAAPRREPRPSGRRATAGWVIGLITVFSAAIGVTFAIWSASVQVPGGVVTAGNLSLGNADTVTWVETTPGAASPRSGSGTASLALFTGVPGDTVEVRYQVTTDLAGDNLVATLGVELADAEPTGLHVTGYRILDSAATPLAPTSGYAPLGTPVQPAVLATEGSTTLLVAVAVTWTGAVEYTSNVTGTEPPSLAAIPLLVSLDQARSGPGFTS